MLYRLLLLLVITLPLSLSAQILRMDKGAMLADSSNFLTGKVSLDAAMNNRNSTADKEVLFTMLRGRGDVGYVSEKHVYYFIADAKYFQSTGGPLQSTGFLHLRTNLMRMQKLSYELFAQGQYDQGRNLKERLLAGGGVRLMITEKLAFGTGVMQELENWKSLGDDDSILTKNLTKSTSYLSGDIDFSETTQLRLATYFQTGYDTEIKAMRSRLDLSARLNLKIGKKFNFTTGYIYSYEDRPIIPISKRVYTFSNGLNYAF